MKTSIVILTYNKLDYTKLCIDSIRKFTDRGSYEIIVIDNGSTDNTRQWLAGQEDILSILNSENKGFPGGCNQGIEKAAGDNILLLNNDIIVTSHWLENLVKALYSSEEIGAVGPISNSVSNFQRINTSYKTIEEMLSFARTINKADCSKWEYRMKLVGFCLLIKRSVVDKVGLLDENFFPGNFEDDDYCCRIMDAGYKLLLCRDTFIHHFGSVSFGEKKAEFRQLLLRNEEKFTDKWRFNPIHLGYIRNDIIPMIERPKEEVIRVLQIGCGSGSTLIEIKNRYKNAELYGTEMNQQLLNFAKNYAQVQFKDKEDTNLGYEEGYFDYIILAEILENVSDPKALLIGLRKYLKSEGELLTCIPNVMHLSVIKSLLRGQFNAVNKGIIYPRPRSLFTLADILEMIKEAGYKKYSFKAQTTTVSDEDENLLDTISKLSALDSDIQFKAYNYLIRIGI